MIRVLQILQGGSSFGGVENFIYQYYKNIDHSIIQFDFVFISQDSMESKWNDVVFSNSNHIALGLNIRNIRQIYHSLLSYLKKNQYDCIHVNTGNITIQYPCLCAAKKVGIKTRIAHSHSTGGNIKYIGVKGYICRAIQKRIYNSCTIKAGCSYEAAFHIFGKFANKNDILIVPNAIDTSRYLHDPSIRQSIRKEFNLLNYKTFIQVGSIYSVKNHIFTINLFKEINKIFKDWKLIIVGKGELEDSIKQLVSDYGLSEKVIFTGFRNDVNYILQGVDCLLLPSLWEGFPLTAIEGQAAGLEVICSNNVPMSANVTGNCVFLPLEIDKWVNACLNPHKLCSDPINRIIESGYDIKIAAERLTRLYQNMST